MKTFQTLIAIFIAGALTGGALMYSYLNHKSNPANKLFKIDSLKVKLDSLKRVIDSLSQLPEIETIIKVPEPVMPDTSLKGISEELSRRGIKNSLIDGHIALSKEEGIHICLVVDSLRVYEAKNRELIEALKIKQKLYEDIKKYVELKARQYNSLEEYTRILEERYKKEEKSKKLWQYATIGAFILGILIAK